jgi:hypothetical protein
MNRGAHYENDIKVISDINGTLSYVFHHYPHMSVIWRDTAAGHNDVQKTFYDGPLKEPPSMLNLPYHWDDFERQNNVIRR